MQTERAVSRSLPAINGSAHINIKELIGALYGVLSFASQLHRGMNLRQWLDPSVAIANLRNWTSRSPLALAILRIYLQ